MSRIGSVIATVVLAGGLVAVTASPAQAAALTVNSTADTATSGDSACTLREAITNANANADTTGGDCAAGSGADTITFASSVTGTITLGSQLPVVTDAAGLTVTGPGATVLTVSGSDAVRLFETAVGALFSVSGVTLADGRAGSGDGGVLHNRGVATLTDVVASGNSSGFSAGAVENLGTLTIAESTFTGNSAAFGGGAIRSTNGSAITITDSVFRDNAANEGGALETFGATVVTRSTFTGNSATVRGGAISASPSGLTLTISESEFDGNTTDGLGGAVRVGLFSGLVVERSTFHGNASTNGQGGALEVAGPLRIDSSTFSANTAVAGGAIRNESFGQELTIRNSTFSANSATAGAATLHRPGGGGTASGSILSSAPGQANCLAAVTDGGANIDSGASCGFTAPSGAAWGSNVAALLGPLADNGGATETFLPLTGSPALDAIDPGQLGCPTVTPEAGDLVTDQRGIARPQGPKCDIGAVEVEPAPVVYTVSQFGRPVTNEPGSTRVKGGDTLPLRFTVTDDAGKRITDLTGAEVTIALTLSTCGTPNVVVDTSFAAGSALSLRADGSYQVDLKTQRSWSGLCGTVTVSTPNGGERTANLQFTGGGRGRG